jgi:DNA/RNA-binding domain of Phe-tRNA-synthetase-like protein
MVRRVARGDRLPRINALVDIGNLVSLRHLMPVGVHPLTSSSENLVLRTSTDGDTFIPPGSTDQERPLAQEVVFASGSQVLTRRWTWRQALGTQTELATCAVLFNVDALPPAQPSEVTAAMKDICDLVNTHCGGEVRCVVVDQLHPSTHIEAGL